MKPRLLMVSRFRYALPLDPGQRQKFDALAEEFELRVLASAPEGAPTRDGTFTLVRPLRPRALDGLGFHAGLPLRVARELRRFRPHAVFVQGTHEAAAVLLGRRLAGSDAKVVLDVHGEWAGVTRLYGSPLRRLLSPAADRVAARAVQAVDAIRTVSGSTTARVRELGAEPAAVFPAFVELDTFCGRPVEPLPERPQALFVGALERIKNVDGLAAAWRLAAPRVPGAALRLVGAGALVTAVERLVRELPEQTSWTPQLAPADVARALDGATALVLPSRSEGLPRVVLEALCRGRGVIGTRVGGIPDLVSEGESGLLVEPGDVGGLAEALVRVLSDRAVAERLGAGAADSSARWLVTPREHARLMRELIERTLKS